jgi:addiction module HigA family antidote
MTTMHDPAHPGEILRELVLAPLGMTVSEAAERLGVSRKTLHKILAGTSGVTADMALRLEEVFGKPDATHWLRLQAARDLWIAREARRRQGSDAGRPVSQ